MPATVWELPWYSRVCGTSGTEDNNMNILVIGGGGREHAVAAALRKSPRVNKIWCAPGNGGTAGFCENVPVSATDLNGVRDFCARTRPDLVVVTPDDPLALGMVDMLEEMGVPAFGPVQKAAEIESSKAFAKAFMARHNIPTAACFVFDRPEDALRHIAERPAPMVIKADGLAAGKGVFICETKAEAMDAARLIQVDKAFGEAGSRVLVEDFLTGPEVSVLCFTDGKTIVPLPAAQDHKRLLNGDRGPNTGGMGAYSPVSVYTPELAQKCMEKIFRPTVNGMAEEGRVFRGVLYFSLMLTSEGPMVIEYNARLGDPETQVVLPLLRSDLVEILLACRNSTLTESAVVCAPLAGCCVVMAGKSYPQGSDKGLLISGVEEAEKTALVFQAGTQLKDGALYTSGGRVLCVSYQAPTLRDAVAGAYSALEKVHFEGAQYRTDIAAKDPASR